MTGATGFVGGALVWRLASDVSFNGVVDAVRSKANTLPQGVKQVLVTDLLQNTDWSEALQGIDAVVHCAARVHVILDDATEPLQAYREMNVRGTLNLAQQAAKAGVRRFVFVSSIKVNGEATQLGQPFTADDEPAPLDPYGISKLEAEIGLREIEAHTSMEVVIVRPPLVYGPGVKANFASMLKWVALGLPLPLGGIKNARSLVAIDNLVDILVICIRNPTAAGQTLLVSDGEDVSTSELLRRIALVMERKSILLPVPAFLIEWGAALVGKRLVARQLCGSLQIDINKTRQLLRWNPPVSLDEGLRRTIKGHQ